MKTIFISYSHKDKRWLEELEDFLKPLTWDEGNPVSLWIDNAKIKSGDIWKDEITKALAAAQIAILLVTQRFIASDFIRRNELPPLLENARTRGVKILWIAVSKSTVKDTEINKYQALNDPSRPLDRLDRGRRNDVLHQIYEKVKQSLELPFRQPETAVPDFDKPQDTSGLEASGKPLAPEVSAEPVRQDESNGIEVLEPSLVRKAGQESGTNITNNLGMNFALILKGTFQMGSPAEEKDRYDNERQHQVTISTPFYLQTTAITQGQWEKVMGSNPSNFSACGQDCPVERISWDDVQEFIRRLNQMEKTDTYRLPTEAEWEYACRAKSTSRFCFGDDEAKLKDYAWFADNSGGTTHPVGQLQPNAWGLYDMHGNVWEWCQDWYGPYPDKAVTDPKGPHSGRGRVLRGGSWDLDSWYHRSAYRYDHYPGYRYINLGFRVARTL